MRKAFERQIGIYEKHGASEELADSLVRLFLPQGYSPQYSLEQRMKEAEDPTGIIASKYAGFDMLLLGRTDEARAYLEKAQVGVEPEKYRQRIQVILDNLDAAQQVVSSSIDDFNQLRQEKGLKSFEHYL